MDLVVWEVPILPDREYPALRNPRPGVVVVKGHRPLVLRVIQAAFGEIPEEPETEGPVVGVWYVRGTGRIDSYGALGDPAFPVQPVSDFLDLPSEAEVGLSLF